MNPGFDSGKPESLGPDYCLRFLGGAVIESPDGILSGRAAHRHRVALLALLALADRPVSRDKIIALLWPGSDTDRARDLLKTSAHVLRRALGDHAVVSIGDGLQLGPTVRCDVRAFRTALAAGDRDAAVALYGGPFLDGFFLNDAQEFSYWLDAERDRLAAEYSAALERLAAEAEHRSDLAAAVVWWRRLAAHDPYSSRLALRLVTALDRAGDRAAALRHGRAHIERLARDLESAPPSELRALLDEWRSGPPDEPAELGVAAQEASPSHPPALAGTTLPALGTRKRRLWWPTAAAAGLALAAAGLFLPSRSYAPSDVRVAVLPFVVRGDAGVQYLAQGIADLLSTALDGVGDWRAVPPSALATVAGDTSPAGMLQRAAALARQLNAHRYVTGTVVQAGARLQVRAGLYDASRRGGGPLMEAVVSGAADSVHALVDELAGRFAASAPGVAAAGEVAARTTHSLPALKAYLEGERAFRSGRFAQAVPAFQRALAFDSTFALAYYRLSLASLWADLPQADPEEADRRALRFSDRLSPREGQLVQAFVDWRAGRADTAEWRYRKAVAEYPADVEAWHQLGETYFHYNPLRGRPIAEARASFERVLALDPEHWGARWHLALLAASDGRREDLREALSRLRAAAPGPERDLELRALESFSGEDEAARRALLAELERADGTRVFDIAWRVAVHLGRVADAERIAEIMTRPGRSEWNQLIGHVTRSYFALARGRPRAAREELAAAGATHPGHVHQPLLEIVARTISVGAPDTAGLLQHRDRLRGWRPRARLGPYGEEEDAWMPSYGIALASLVLGDSVAARAAADTIDATRKKPRAAMTIRAALAHAAGRNGDAQRLLHASDAGQWFGWLVADYVHVEGHRAYLRGSVLVALGRDREALDWFGATAQHGPFDLGWLGPALLRRAEIYERLGDRAAAALEYQRFVALWHDCEPELRPVVDRARHRLAALNQQ